MKLTKPQKLVYDMEQFAGGAIAVICGSMLMEGECSHEKLPQAIRDLYRLNDALRMHIVHTNDGVELAVTEFSEKAIEVLCFANKAQLDFYASDYAKAPIDLHGDLCEIKIVELPGRYGILVKMHHLIGDAWTLSLLGSQLQQLLNGETPQAYSYAEYESGEAAYLASKRCEKDKAFFMEQFAKCEEVTYLSDKQVHSYAAERKTVIVEADEARVLADYMAGKNTTAFPLFMTALAIYMSRIKLNVEKFYIGTAVLNRTGNKEKNTMGMYINTVPLLMELNNENTFAENLACVEEAAFGIFRHQKYNYGDVLTDIRKEYSFTEKLYDIMLSYQNAALIGAAESTWYHSGMQTESLQIHIDDRDNKGVFRIHYDYQTEKFTAREIERMHRHIMTLLLDAISNENKKLHELSLLTEEEAHRILVEFNDTKADYPRDKCVHTLFEEQVAENPNKTAVIACDGTLTYDQLNRRANRIAHGLIAKGIQPGDIVAFMLPRTGNLLALMFGILKAGAAYLPIDLEYPQERINYTVNDSCAKLLITETVLSELLESHDEENPNLALSSESFCYCIYTSGSTGKPKGVMIRHRNLVNVCSINQHNTYQRAIVEGGNTLLSTAKCCFDAFAIDYALVLLNGCTMVLAADSDIVDGRRLAQLIANHSVTAIQSTPSAIRTLCANEEYAEALQQIKVIILAAESFFSELYPILRTYTNAEIFNGYGPTETTVGVAIGKVTSEDVHIGRNLANTQIYILDNYDQIVPRGAVGQICIGGAGVGAGYLNRPELTAEKFVENPFGEGKLYKTGDLAYWREDGNLAYVGRNDYQVKIRGLRIELGEIENAMDSVEGISQAVVVVRKNESGRQLICAFYTGEELDAGHIRDVIKESLPRYMLPHVITHVDALPMTISGKVNRNALPAVDLNNVQTQTEYIAPSTPQEVALTAAVQSVLKVDKVGILDHFFDLGGDSLKAIELIAHLEKVGYTTDAKTIFACDTIRDLAAVLTLAEQQKLTWMPLGDIPATPAQMRVYTAQSMQPDSTLYNMPCVFRAEQVDADRLQAAVEMLIKRHDMFRTHFEEKDGIILQVVEEKMEFALEELTSDDIATFVRPFNLDKAPLLRVGCYKNTVMIDMHHIITDGGSVPVFIRELNDLYMGRTLSGDPTPYTQFAIRPQTHSEDEQYWMSVYGDEVPVLELNTDYKRGQKRSYQGSAVYSSIDGASHQKVLEKCHAWNITPYVFYMGAFYVLLSKFSGNEDIVVGMPISGREADFLNTIGMFVNTIALRNKPEGVKTVREFLREVKNTSVEAISHQSYPYGELVKKLGLNATERNPLFDVMFAYQSDSLTAVTFGDKSAELLPIPVTTAKYDISFNVMPRSCDVVVMIEYCTALYRNGTAERLADAYRYVLEQMLDADAYIKDITAVTSEEEHTLRVCFNDTNVDYPRDKCVHTLFEEQVDRTPNKTAVIACDATLTYRALDGRANKIANGLIEAGVVPGDIVAFMLPRTSNLIATMFGILKTGAAYLPVDPDYPEERISYMLEDSNAKLCVTTSMVEYWLQSNAVNAPGIQMSSSSICYCIYTSGSTGKPKGTLLSHQNVANYVNSNGNNTVVRRIVHGGFRNIVSTTTVGFDIFVTESILPLVNGVEVVLADEDAAKMQRELNALLCKTPVDILQTTPTKMRSLIADQEQIQYLETLKVIVLGGETLDSSLIEQLKMLTNAETYNIYGPTETTVWATNAEILNNCESCGLYSIFEKRATEYGHTAAVIYKDSELTYSELYSMVENISSNMAAMDVCANDVVAVHLNRSHLLAAFQLATLKLGSVFLPVDKRYPADRIQRLCDDCRVKLFITDENCDYIHGTKVVSDNELVLQRSESPVKTHDQIGNSYMIYTSGSTGTPKGCVLTGSGLRNFVLNNNTLEALQKRESNIFACVNSVSFDYFIAESLLPLLNGYTTVVLDDECSTNQEAFLREAKSHGINVLMTTPTRLKIYFADNRDDDILKQLTCICTSGEPLPQDLLASMWEKAPNAKIYNPLGPSECTVWDVGGELDRDAPTDIHIGKPIANTQIYIVDKEMHLVPIGVTGELCIAGDGVGAGYLNRPELTAEKFMDNPFGEGKLYKTGDLAYWREDGNIAYVGRNDFQVKIRGLRIELGEIENAIDCVDGISQAVVVVRKNAEGRQLICAFYTQTEAVSVETIRAALEQKLPRYMLPHIFTVLDEMPLTSSGKANRKALPEIDLNCVESSTEYVKPEGELEKQLAKLMEQALGYAPVGRNDHFFDLGGDSLKAIEMISKAHTEGIYVSLQNVFDYPTVQQLADCIVNGDKQVISFVDMDFSGIDRVLAKNCVENIREAERVPLGNILFAGATGFLGIHILADYLEHDSGTAYCLVRGKDEADSRNRLDDLLRHYFGETYVGSERIKVICADLQKDCFGLSEKIYTELLSSVDTVINTAASVKHYGSYRYFYEVNVESVHRLIQFCKEADVKLIHTSTISVSGNSFADQFDGYVSETEKHFYESSLYIGQPLDNVYARSKFEAEKAILDAMQEGLRANIMRMGNLTNRLSDGMFQRNHESNAFLQRIRGALELGMIPDDLLDGYTEFTPIDEAANAIMTIARHFSSEFTVFHINTPKIVFIDKLTEYFRTLGYSIEAVCGNEFETALKQTADQAGMEHIFEAFINDMDETGHLNYDSNIRIENDFTVQYLKMLGFEWSDIEFEYLERYVKYFERIGFFK